MSLHISFTPAAQPATHFRVEEPQRDWRKAPRYRWITRPAHAKAWCDKCRRRRYLKNLLILEQTWYDPIWFCRTCPPKPRRRRPTR